ncbi:hypothetical protein OIU79_017456 [Salix purpurea]|uniref:Uncharacterized protein n=1 Tax=Salix purpurea TaxID=77065 RepID=A0A9Q0WXL1_SALPP|nr:hypothetical protein OIU79_017456 [Salix purpurea]
MFKKARPRGMRCGLEIGGAIFYFINSQREPAVHFIFTHTTALRKLFPCPSQASSFFSDRKSTGTKVGASIAFADKKSTPPIILELQAKNKSPSADQTRGFDPSGLTRLYAGREQSTLDVVLPNKTTSA